MTQEELKKFIKKNREDMDFNYNYRGGHFIEPEITLSKALDELEKAVNVIKVGKDEMRCYDCDGLGILIGGITETGGEVSDPCPVCQGSGIRSEFSGFEKALKKWEES